MIEDFEFHAQADVISYAGSGGYLLAYFKLRRILMGC